MAKKRKPEIISVAHSKLPLVLGIIGGIITILIALIILIKLGNRGAMEIVFGIWGLVVGIVITVASILLRVENKFRLGSILLIVFSALGLITLQGLIIGPIIGLIAGILTQVRKMI